MTLQEAIKLTLEFFPGARVSETLNRKENKETYSEFTGKMVLPEKVTLKDYVSNLLIRSKTSRDPEFISLLNLFGREKIVKYVKEIKASKK